MNDLIIKIITILILFISIIIAIFSFNTNELGAIHIFNYSVVIPNNNMDNQNIDSNALVIVENVNIATLQKGKTIAYIDINNNQSVQKLGMIESLKITESGAYIYSVNNKNIDSSCVIGMYKIKIPLLGKVFAFLLTRDGFLLAIVTPLLLIAIYRLFYFVDHVNEKNVG